MYPSGNDQGFVGQIQAKHSDCSPLFRRKMSAIIENVEFTTPASWLSYTTFFSLCWAFPAVRYNVLLILYLDQELPNFYAKPPPQIALPFGKGPPLQANPPAILRNM